MTEMARAEWDAAMLESADDLFDAWVCQCGEPLLAYYTNDASECLQCGLEPWLQSEPVRATRREIAAQWSPEDRSGELEQLSWLAVALIRSMASPGDSSMQSQCPHLRSFSLPR